MIFSFIFLFLLINHQIFTVISSNSSLEDHPDNFVGCEADSIVDFENVATLESIVLEESDQSARSDSHTNKKKDSIVTIKHNTYSTHTLMVNRVFDIEWKNILSGLEIILPVTGPVRLNIFARRKNPLTRLMTGIEDDNYEEVHRAISEGAKFLSNGSTDRIMTLNYYPIEYVVVKNKLEALKAMLNHMEIIQNDLKATFYGGLLIRAVQAGHLEVVRFLVRNYAAPYLSNSFLFQQAIMHMANLKMLLYLVKQFGKEPEIHQFYGKHQDSALHLAIKYNNFEAFQFIFFQTELPTNARNRDGLLPVHLILKSCRTQFLSNLFSAYPLLRSSWVDEYGNNLLHLAVHQKRIDLVKEFVEVLGFDVNFVNDDGQTPVYFAYALELDEIASFLVEKGANLLQADKRGYSPLLLLADSNNLTRFRMEINSLTSHVVVHDLRSLVKYLITRDLWDCVEIVFEKFPHLLKKSFKINEAQINQLISSQNIMRLPILFEFLIIFGHISPYTLLHLTAATGNIKIMKMLLKSGVTLRVEDGNREIPLEIAIRYGKFDMVRLLLRHSGSYLQKTSTTDFFKIVLNYGASFIPLTSAYLQYDLRHEVINHFSRYFKSLSKAKTMDPVEITIICLQLEIFIYYHIIDFPIIPIIATSIQTLQFHLISVSKLVLEQNTNGQLSLLYILLTAHTAANSAYLRNFIQLGVHHSIPANELLPFIDPQNEPLLQEYAAILSQ